MRRYERQEVTVERDVEVAAACDGCGIAEGVGAMGRLLPVVISIDDGEEGRHVDHLDYCDNCLVQRAPAFVIAGSRAPLVTGEELPLDEDEQ